MKKILFATIITATALLFAACEPEVIKGPQAGGSVEASAVQSAFVIDGQFADVDCTTPQTDGNFIKYHTDPPFSVQISNEKNGVKTIIASGFSGVFNIKPKRGSDPNQTYRVEAINPDGSVVGFDKSVTVFVPGELDPEYKLLLGDGVKSWTWHFDEAAGVACWGNAGNSGNGAGFTWNTVDGKWWGVATPEELATPDQIKHAGGTPTGAEAAGAYMTFDEDGNITSYTPSGKVIAQSTYTIKDYDSSRSSGWQIGKLVTADPSILFPFSINGDASGVKEFNIMYLDKNYMTLVDEKNPVGGWGEITYWMFKNKSGVEDALNGGSERTWTWNSNGNEFWGNAGSTGAGANFTPGVVDGKWWGVKTTEEFQGQLAHAPGGVATGAEDTDAYMVFNADGKVTSYTADGKEIISSDYEVSDFDETRSSGWQLGYLAAPGILFPYSINTNGATPAKFSIMYVDADNLTLVDDKSDIGGWGEITFWVFKAKH